MGEVLISYPGYGSLWLSNAYYEGDFVVGDAFITTDWPHGEEHLMNFPKACIRKVVGTVTAKDNPRKDTE